MSLNVCMSYKRAKTTVLIRMVFLQGRNESQEEFREKKRSKREIVMYRRERKRPCCFDDFSRQNEKRTKVTWTRTLLRLAPRAPISRATRYIGNRMKSCSYITRVTKIGRT